MPGHLALVVVFKWAQLALEEGGGPLQSTPDHVLRLHVEQDHLGATVESEACGGIVWYRITWGQQWRQWHVEVLCGTGSPGGNSGDSGICRYCVEQDHLGATVETVACGGIVATVLYTAV